MTTTTSATSSASSTATTTSTSSTSSTSASSLGQSILTSLNATNGIDTDSLVTQLTAAQKASLEDPITTAQTTNTAQISSAAQLASDMTNFQSALSSLISGGTLTTQPTSSDSTSVGVALTAGASIGDITSTVQVNQLAQSQTIESQAYTSSAAASLGGGTLTITVNGTATTINNGSGSSLSDLAAAINTQKTATGVTASVATDSQGNQRLVLKGATGAASAFSVSSTDYPALNFDPTQAGGTTTAANSTTMGQDQVAQDASVKVDGVTYTSATNSVSNAIQGVTLTLIKANTTVVVGSQRPTTAITQAVSDFVSAYNTVIGDIGTATAAASSTASAGALRGNSTVRDMLNQLRQLTTTKLIAGGSISTLAELGVATQKDGTLTLDTTQLNKMVTAYPDDVERMFNPQQSSSNSAIKIASAVGTVASGVYQVTGVSSSPNASPATGTINGVPMTGVNNVLSGTSASGTNGLTLYLNSGLSNASATLSIDLGLSGALTLLTTALTGTNGSLTALQSSLTTQQSTLADKLTAADAQVTVYHDRLVTQFTAMNTRVSNYKATSSYLTQQVDEWTKSSS